MTSCNKAGTRSYKFFLDFKKFGGGVLWFFKKSLESNHKSTNVYINWWGRGKHHTSKEPKSAYGVFFVFYAVNEGWMSSGGDTGTASHITKTKSELMFVS